MSFAPEPAFDHHQRPTTGVLIVNLGTPDAPTPSALRRYLGQFLSDPRVVEIPRAVWKPILHGIILRTRPGKSAAKYASIWAPEGSPLRTWTNKQGTLLQGYLGERGHRLSVKWAMRYGQPSIASQLDALKAEGARRVLVVPLYPQYSGATTASVMDDVFAWGRRTRHLPELRFVNHFHDDERYIAALADSVRAYWQREGQGDKLVMSIKPTSDGEYSGTAFDPQRDLTYKLTVSVKGASMTTKGCVLAGIVCKGVNWTRIN